MCSADGPDVPSEPETNTEQEQLRVSKGEDQKRASEKRKGIKALTVSLNSSSSSGSGGSSLKA